MKILRFSRIYILATSFKVFWPNQQFPASCFRTLQGIDLLESLAETESVIRCLKICRRVKAHSVFVVLSGSEGFLSGYPYLVYRVLTQKRIFLEIVSKGSLRALSFPSKFLVFLRLVASYFRLFANYSVFCQRKRIF